jgi:hypothetical protein
MIIKKKGGEICILIDVATLSVKNVTQKETENKLK